VIPDLEHDVAILRDLMARELETINAYRSLAAKAPDGQAREFFLHIIEEEKLHVADVLRAIAALDEDQAHLLTTGFPADHAPGDIPAPLRAAPSAAPVEEAPRGTSPRSVLARGELTVGSLRGVPMETGST
jgi:rubrerythrin